MFQAEFVLEKGHLKPPNKLQGVLRRISMCTGGCVSMLDGAGKWLYCDSESAHPTFSSPTACLLWTGAMSWLTHGSCLLTDVMIAWLCLLTRARRTQLTHCSVVLLSGNGLYSWILLTAALQGLLRWLSFTACRTETPLESPGQQVCVSGGATARFWPLQQVHDINSHTNTIVAPCW